MAKVSGFGIKAKRSDCKRLRVTTVMEGKITTATAMTVAPGVIISLIIIVKTEVPSLDELE